MKAEIITIGDEILIGQTVDTNSAWMAEQLHMLGIRLNRIVSISDTPEEITAAADEGFSRADLLLVTGGLGPTRDDVTKQTLAEYFNTSLELNTEVLDGIEAFFSSRGMQMLESNKLQAELPKAALILKNTRGTAMGMWFERNGKVLISMPGVPYEMKGIMTEYGLPKIASYFKTQPILHKTVLTQGIGESFLAEKINDWELSLRNDGISLAYLPSPGLVKLRLSGYAANGNAQEVEAKMNRYIEELNRRVPRHIFGRDKQSLAEVVGELLISKSQTLSTAESCTGGYIAHLITAVPGSSRFFMGSVVAYANSAKENLLGVPADKLIGFGAVSEEVVISMAEGVREKMGTTYGISTSGVAGPEGGSPEKPVGTVWIGLAGPEGSYARKFNFGRSRSRNITVTALWALNILRNEIIGERFE